VCKNMCLSGQKWLMTGNPCSAVSSGDGLNAKQTDSAQMKADFRLQLTVPDGPPGPEALFM